MSLPVTIIARAIWVAAAAAITAFALTATAAPAGAVDCSDFPYAGEQGMINSDCRENTIDPGVGNMLQQQDLMRPRARALLNEHGFSDQWLWYAPMQRRTFHLSEGVTWSFCDTYNPGQGRFGFTSAGFVCDGNQPLGFTEVTGSFQANSVSLDVFSFGRGFISLACGNFSEPPVADPVPWIEVFKFHDYDGDGVQDAGEPPMAGVRFTAGRSSSRVGQGPAVLGTFTTNSQGLVRVRLIGHGPGTYYFEEHVPDGFVNTTPGNRHSVEVEFGAGQRAHVVAPFGNAQADTDVVKAFELVDGPEKLEVGVPAGFTLETTLTNLGPAGPVTVYETLSVTGPSDCAIVPSQISREVTLGAPGAGGHPPSMRTFQDAITVTCSDPSFHQLTFSNEVAIVRSSIEDVDLSNNSVEFDHTVPVFADADLALTDLALDCSDTTEVDTYFTCTATGKISNLGSYGPVDATLRLTLTSPEDCTTVDSVALSLEAAPVDTPVGFLESWTVECSNRSFHKFTLDAAASADDIHIRDVAGTNTASATDTIEVFQDADLAVTSVHLECDEVVGGGPFTCQAEVDVANRGPAPDVHAMVWADLSLSDECETTPERYVTSQSFVQGIDARQSLAFSWAVFCPASDVLHPFKVTTDIVVDLARDPHAVDRPDPQVDVHVVPYCVETVNPHGKQVPQAPGQGQNEDGFYEVGTLPGFENAPVWVRDTGTGMLFGPFASGTKIKYVEANGAPPSISPMGGNNGKGKGQANAVDYQIRGQGDMQVVTYDEQGDEVTSLCLVPPFPK